MTTPDHRSIFDLSREEMDERFQKRLSELRKEFFAKGLPITYQDERCPTADYFIQEYEGGTSFLAFLDVDRHKFIPVRQLSSKNLHPKRLTSFWCFKDYFKVRKRS